MSDCKKALVKFEQWGEYGYSELAVSYNNSIEINERKQLVVDGVVMSVKGEFYDLVLDDDESSSELFNSCFKLIEDYCLNK